MSPELRGGMNDGAGGVEGVVSEGFRLFDPCCGEFLEACVPLRSASGCAGLTDTEGPEGADDTEPTDGCRKSGCWYV